MMEEVIYFLILDSKITLNYIPDRKITVILAASGVGKSSLLIAFACRITNTPLYRLEVTLLANGHSYDY